MLPRLRAEEQLERFNLLIAVEGRQMEDADRRQFLQELQTQSLGQRPRAQRASRGDLASVGIRVRREDAAPSESWTPVKPEGEQASSSASTSASRAV